MRIADMPKDWPGRGMSREVLAAGIRWHVQDNRAEGPALVLIHGAGGATHSWRALWPLLQGYRLYAFDLPGQGFSTPGTRGRAGLEPMADDIAALLAAEGIAPAVLVGHSAGAALALQLAEILPGPPRAIVAINPALGTFEGVAGWLFPLFAKLLALNPFVPRLFARLSGHPSRVRSLLASTGSPLDASGVALYQRLVADPAHVDGTLSMMAQWSLDGLIARLPGLAVPSLFILGTGDRAVPPAQSEAQAARLPDCRVVRIAGAGHLVHEEAAGAVAGAMLPFLAERGVRPAA